MDSNVSQICGFGFKKLIYLFLISGTVDYTADSINGFNAIVVREPLKGAAVAQPVVKSIVSQPILKSYIAQPAYAAPAAVVSQPAFVAQSSYIQPIVKSYAQPAISIAQPALLKSPTIAYPQL